ncbi:MAG TPA: RluA family pseudouridine synthase [Candidatus Competibacteraceae bacterium]|nr:RluA family pseudouridine synthase [Candidatus Competibacteraceae bacterium]
MNPTDCPASASLVEVPAEYHGQRIDNFLVRHLKGVPKSLIYRILRTGQVRVNKGRVKPDYRLGAGDSIRIPPLRVSSAQQPVSPPQRLLERLRAAVLHEDDELLVLNKPAGLAVHGGSGIDFGVIEALRVLRPELPFLELAHRLDRDTSGCLLLAKNPDTLRAIQRGLQGEGVDKRYLALVRGHWQLGTRTVEAALVRNVQRGGERLVGVDDAGKSSFSRFRPVTCRAVASLMEVAIATGRTHQIRVHAAHLGHPLAGDDKYGDREFNRYMAREYGLRRLFLHAHSVGLELPRRSLAFSAPLPEELAQVVERLERQR